MGGLTFEKLFLIAVIAVFLLGPDKLPHYAAQLARLVKSLRSMADGAKDRMREEMGPEFDEVDWKKLDPRQYDPRRIIREALVDDVDDADSPLTKPQSATVRPAARAATSSASTSASGGSVRAAAARQAGGDADELPKKSPFDSEAT